MRMRCSGLAGLILWFVPAATAFAQQPPPFEIAAQASVLRLSDFGLNTPVGIGGRLSFDVKDWLTLEGEVTYYPADKMGSSGTVSSIGDLRIGRHRRRTDALFGVKIGLRGARFGAFAKARPGFTQLSDRGMFCEGPGCAVVLISPAPIDYRTEFAFDLGGGLEFYPRSRLVARVEIGDTIIRNRSRTAPCSWEPCTTHNLSSRFGFGYRF